MKFNKILTIILLLCVICVAASGIVFAATGQFENGVNFTFPSGFSEDTNDGDAGVTLQNANQDVILLVTSNVTNISSEVSSNKTYTIGTALVEEDKLADTSNGITYAYFIKKSDKEYQVIATMTSDSNWKVDDSKNPVNQIIVSIDSKNSEDNGFFGIKI